MRVSKKISYEKAKSLSRFIMLKKKINKLIEKKPESPISNIDDISRLNYYLVIDCKDVSQEFSFNKNNGKMFFGDEETNKNFIEFLRAKNSQPSYFKKLGLFYELSGCYIVGTTKSSKKNISIYNSMSTVSCKLDINDLPNEIKEMCESYEEHNFDNKIKLNPYMSNILNVTDEERDKIIESIVSSIVFDDIPKQAIYPSYNISEVYSEANFGGFSVEHIVETKIDDIYDISFLNQVMNSAIDEDNFELCAKIRDRINYLKSNKK